VKTVDKLFFCAIFFLLSVSCATISTDTAQRSPDWSESDHHFETSSHSHFERLAGIQNLAKPLENSFSMDFGPQLLKVKASYLEKTQPAAATMVDSPDASPRRYLNLLGTTSFGGSHLIGEGEMTYGSRSIAPGGCECLDWPRMMRLGLKTRWQGLSYGADFKSVEKGFVSIAGTASAQDRDEGELWGEYNLGPFNLRGSLAESWEELLDENRHRVTRAATTTVKLKRSVWGGSFSSSYGLVEQGPDLNQEMTVLTNRLTGFYRPFSVLSVGPSIGIKHEWDAATGYRSETPTTDLSFVYSPFQDEFKFTGGTSLTRTLNRYALSDVMTVASRAVIDWKIGKFIGRNDTLSFNINYNRQRDLISSANSSDDLSGILQLKITGF
jgi:hypothetical protein